MQQIGAAVQPCSRAVRQLRRSSRGVVRRWRSRRQQRRGAALATAAAETAANGECHRSASSRSPVMAAWGGPTGETAVLLDANNRPNHLGGLCQLLHRGQHRPVRFPELVRREPQDQPAPRPAASARGRCSGRSAPKIVIACIRVSDFHRRADSGKFHGESGSKMKTTSNGIAGNEKRSEAATRNVG